MAAIIPALNEQDTIANVVLGIDPDWVDQVIVVDNGSSDATTSEARAAGARVVRENRRGYGSACLAGIAAADTAHVLVFLDGDGSDDPADIRLLLEELEAGQLDLVIGSRTLGRPQRGALTPVQRFGNWLTCGLVRAFWGARFTDLGPLRAIRRTALQRLDMRDPDFGWTIEMQVKAAQRGLRFCEVAVSYRVRQAGASKVSGTITGSVRAGRRILGYVFTARFREGLRTSRGRSAQMPQRRK